jgi:hypothetical protein
MRVRLRELLDERGMTVYGLAKAVDELGVGVSVQAVYRLARLHGAPQRMDVRLLCALYDVLGCRDFNELLTLKPVGEYAPYPPPPETPAVRKARQRNASASPRR